MRYNWQHPHWPHFYVNFEKVAPLILAYIKESRVILGGIQHASEKDKIGAQIELITAEALKTSAIEGEYLQYEEVRSSILKHMGWTEQRGGKDPRAEGIGELMAHLRKTYQEPLTAQTLFDWHKMLLKGQGEKLEVGCWRTKGDPMQIVSGYVGQEKVHFEAPPSSRLPQEMEKFIEYFNNAQEEGPLKAAIIHLYFESIHPFQDGNGRIGRALAEKVLSQELGHPVLLSLSSEIEKNKKQYYEELNKASCGTLDVTEWAVYFCDLILRAQQGSKLQIEFILKRSLFWQEKGKDLNERQQKVLEKMFAKGAEGFKGGMSAKKYMALTHCSKATATRDLSELLEKGCLKKLEGGGRSTSYELHLERKS